MKFLFIAITILATTVLEAQDSTTIKIEAGQLLSEVITPSIRYRFPAFKQGKVLLKDKTSYDSKLNYNLLTGEIDFISREGDTLAIGDALRVNLDRVIIDTNSYFYNNKGYLEVVKESKAGSLAKKQNFIIASTEKIGAYNLSSPASAIDSYSSYMDPSGTFYTLRVREDVTLKLKTEYFFGNEYHLFMPATRKNLDRLFFKKKAEIEKYLKEHLTNFDNEEDLKKLLSFLINSWE
jgi:hypothetical protein